MTLEFSYLDEEMPLSTVCVSTVSSRPRLWSSQTNIRIKDQDVPHLTTMNSTEEISIYRSPQEFYPSPTFQKRTTLGYRYDFPEKTAKKEKKWSIGSLFRRKKKEDSDSSSEEEQKKGFLGRRRRKSDGKKPKPKTVGGFDHIVLPKTPQSYNGYNHHDDTGILSDPSGGFSNYIGRSLPLPPQNAPQSHSTSNSFTNLNNSVASAGSVGSGDSISKKKGKGLIKARAAARRTTLGNDSSSDEDSSLRSNSSLKIRSDESLNCNLESSHNNRKSRAARTERYLKRHSKDGENPHNYLRLSKSDADDNRSPSRSPSNLPPSTRPYPASISSSQASNMSGLSTVPPSHGFYGKYKVSNSTSNPSYKPPLSMNEYNSSINKNSTLDLDKSLNSQRSFSCDANIHKAPSIEDNNVLHVQFPIFRPHTRGYMNFSLIDSSQVNSARQPPQPPPRDPNRMVMPYYSENGRPNTCYFENNSSQPKAKSFHVPTNTSKFLQPKPKSFNFNPSYKSTSEVHIPNDPFQIQNTVRPASTTPEPKSRYITKRNERQTIDSFNYLTDKKPRSRKPIVIQSNPKVEPRKDSPTQKALDFWKKIEESVDRACPKTSTIKPVSNSPQMFTSQTHIQTQVFFPSPQPPDSNRLEPPRNSSPFKPVSPTVKELQYTQVKSESPRLGSTNLTSTSKDDSKRKSSNLEEALDELEAIYNSLRLGDENLLDRAEQRENEKLMQKAEEKKKHAYSSYGGSRGALSDSSFSYEPFDQVDSPRRKKVLKKGKIPDTKEDDMYNRKLTKEKAATICDPQSVISRVSYLLASPVHNAYDSEGELKIYNKSSKEPNLKFDDVMYRNVMHANASPKTVEPQPPFGIPLGPVAPAPNSDYLHAVSDNIIYTPNHIPKKIPDIVKDDLAFRNLRKDSNKEPVLPPVTDVKNNMYPQDNKLDLNYLKKRRAVRSLSANIGNILGKGIRDSDEDVENEFKSKTLTDIADAMEIARKVLQEKGKVISNTRKGFMSDTDVKTPYTNGDSFKESRRKFLNGLKSSENSQNSSLWSPRPPKGMTPERKVPRSPTKESTPIPKSSLERNVSNNSSLDDLLNALAEEAKVTTERITKELKELEDKRSKDKKLDNKILTNKNEIKPCQKLLKAVVDSSQLVEYSKAPFEVTEDIKIHSLPTESANVIQSCFPPSKESSLEKKKDNEPDYENIDSDEDKIDVSLIEKEVEKEEFRKCQSPFEERKAEIVATFQELTNNIDEIKVPKFDSKKKGRKTDSIYDNLDNSPSENPTNADEGERVCKACLRKHIPSNTNPQVFTSNIDFTLRQSDSEHSTCDSARLDPLESLKSPKLVMETSRKCLNDKNSMPKSSNMILELNRSSTSSSVHSSTSDLSRPSTSDASRPNTSHHSRASTSKSDPVAECSKRSDDIDCSSKKPGESWYHDPTKVAVACSYGLACAHQLASIDIVAVLSLLFAVMSFIFALFL